MIHCVEGCREIKQHQENKLPTLVICSFQNVIVHPQKSCLCAVTILVRRLHLLQDIVVFHVFEQLTVN